MELKEISYRRKFNLGNYETEDIELTLSLNPGDDPATAMKWLKEKASAFKTSKASV